MSSYGTLYHPSQIHHCLLFSAMPAFFRDAGCVPYLPTARSSIMLGCSSTPLPPDLSASFCGAGDGMPSSYRRIPYFHGMLQHQAGLLRCTFFLALLASFCDAGETVSFPTARSILFPGYTTTSLFLRRQYRAVSWLRLFLFLRHSSVVS